tara:strand:+ start:1275 stop:2252 length:978 start_codon:yes stop_codon:yes gene_type:complete
MAFGQINFNHYPVLRKYIDAVEYYESVKPITRGKYKGLVPLARRADVWQFMQKDEHTGDINIYLETPPMAHAIKCFAGVNQPILSFRRDEGLKIGFRIIHGQPDFNNKVCHMVHHILGRNMYLGWTWGMQPVVYRHTEYNNDIKHNVYFAPNDGTRWHFDGDRECLNAGTGLNWVVNNDKKRVITQKYRGLFDYIKTATAFMQLKDRYRWGETVVDEDCINRALSMHEDIIPALANPEAFDLHSQFVTNALESWGQMGYVSKRPKVIAAMLRNVIYKYYARIIIEEVKIGQRADGSSDRGQFPTRTSDKYRLWHQKAVEQNWVQE